MKQLALALLMGCGGAAADAGLAAETRADAGGSAVDDAGDDATSTADPCGDAPVVAWANGAHGVFIEHCQPCHASTALDRHGAPPDVVFDTRADAQRWADRVQARAVDAATMPPAGGVLEQDRALLALWLQCGVDR